MTSEMQEQKEQTGHGCKREERQKLRRYLKELTDYIGPLRASQRSVKRRQEVDKRADMDYRIDSRLLSDIDN